MTATNSYLCWVLQGTYRLNPPYHCHHYYLHVNLHVYLQVMYVRPSVGTGHWAGRGVEMHGLPH